MNGPAGHRFLEARGGLQLKSNCHCGEEAYNHDIYIYLASTVPGALSVFEQSGRHQRRAGRSDQKIPWISAKKMQKKRYA